MTPSQKQQAERLWELQKITNQTVQDIADQMGKLAVAHIILEQDRWNQIFESWEQTNKRMHEVGEALTKLYGL
ncbi:hypothetical protein [Undibacterium griseum]|uniref:Uncharacterized protein n=1 Tax=Undibacterium griseum TaxID=2762295 RepID=A0ABR6YS70_9BURK|nr:hypothetical protein [Undibacterium griseum]MBC3886630.1 hypothetical protein [Undibacterium griseum]